MSQTGGAANSVIALLGGISYFFSYRIFTQTILHNLFFIKKSLSTSKSTLHHSENNENNGDNRTVSVEEGKYLDRLH
jgi:hypothetical protein